MTASKRRWFAYSLRTLFIVVTVFGCWLGYELNWIRQRHEFIAEQRSVFRHSPTLAGPIDPDDPIQEVSRAPGLLWLFGENGASLLLLQIFVENYDGADSDAYPEVQLAKELFPEAKVTWVVFDAMDHAPNPRVSE